MSDSGDIGAFASAVRQTPETYRSRGQPRRVSNAIARAMVSSGATKDSRLEPDAPLSSHLTYLVFRFILQIFYFCFSGYQWVLYYYHRLRLRISSVAVYHNRTPQLIRSDVVSLEKIPGHVATVLNLKNESEEGGGIDGLLHEVGELAAWCVGAGISVLTVYEKRGILKSMPIQDVNRAITRKLENYFGISNTPKFRLVIPHLHSQSSIRPGDNGDDATDEKFDLVINLISLTDGRTSIVELSKTLADMAMEHKLSSRDLSLSLIDRHLRDILEEPDLVILFSPDIDLQGFPPWQIRLSEIFYLPDNDEVSYVVFLKALQKYAKCKINVGR
ncbi:Nus1p [Sugiyamaella lignohabitans]|uniref:ditrans,polycis-polyprenyl diphosphate synthase [(2E,6E)-farnesyldiphosphate specific] n=1 Tax=Sugiyamaella lignohabitans TaxID=796027 RepID=A0A167C3X6_9ASCO|nr:Nus1p [Sugiyamaella lignohabitans]ANB11186.1 Nus1p [Sugiyamaella lignohabitans]